MDEAEIQEQQPFNLRRTNKHAELISIRKKLADPNNILPGSMLRSQQPIHLLPFNSDLQAQSGSKMLLDDVRTNQSFEIIEKNKRFRSKNILLRANKTKYVTESTSPSKVKQSPKMTEYTSTLFREIGQKDSLSFLQRSLKNLLQFGEQIVFVSKTAFLNNPKINNAKNNKNEENAAEAKRAMILKYLKQNKHFACTSFHYNEHKELDYYSAVPDFPANGDQLVFGDNFQSSNIHSAMRCDEQAMLRDRRQDQKHSRLYLIALRFDYNTKSYGQWFYFKVSRKQQPFSFSRQTNNLFKFMIINMTKSSSMFGKGLKISVCRKGVWRKEGININYYKNSLRREDVAENTLDNMLQNNCQKPDTYFTLEFTLQIYDGEEIYISYNQPYTYSRLGKVLDKISSVYQSNKRNTIDFKRNIICQTYLNNNIEALTFSAKNTVRESQQQKKIVFVISRCHPVETAGSHVLQGVLNNLFSLLIQSPLDEQKQHIVYRLLQKYILKIIPMVNPDGVILGNSRCNIAGYDLNRSWRVARPDRCKQIYAIKKYVMQYQNRIEMFIDLHAHSKKKNVFAYGCHDMSNPFSTRQFPFLLSKLSQNDFLFSQCRFTRLTAGQRSERGGKDGTARVFLYDVLRIPNVFTIQNSYCSAKNSPYHYDKSSYQLIGADILKAISLYFSPNFKQSEDWQIERHTTDIELKVNSKADRNIPIKSAREQLTSSLHKFSATSSICEGLELKLSVNSQFEGRKKMNAVDLREKYLCQLRQNQENISIGLAKDGSASESEEQDRIYQIAKTKKLKSQKEIKKKDRKHSKTAQKLINFMHKNRNFDQADKEKQKEKEKLTSRSPSLLKVSSTHSDTNLVKVTNVSKNRFYTLTKNQESVLIPAFDDQEEIQHRAVPLKMQHKSKKGMITEFDPFNNTRKGISVVDIGLGEYPHMLHDFRANLVDKVQGKFNLKLPYQPQQTIIYRDGQIKDATFNMGKAKDDEIKQYLRKLIRPKQIIERKQRLAARQQKTERTQINLNQSNIQFQDVKLSKVGSNRARFAYKGGL